MTANLKTSRPDIAFLRRRLKPGENVPTAPTAVQTRNLLDLSQTDSQPIGEAPASTATHISARPEVKGRVHLTKTNSVVRLNSRQSAIGSLSITGATEVGWQTTDLENGILYNHEAETADPLKAAIPSNGNRKLIQFLTPKTLIIHLRRMRQLRRVVIKADNGPITISLLDGAVVVLDSENGHNVAYISRINNQIEIRFERITKTLTETFALTP